MFSHLLTQFDPQAAAIVGVPKAERRLSDLRGYFADQDAYEKQLAVEDSVVYTIASVEPAQGDGQLHYGLGMVAPGRVGDEYFMTKGHFHAWRPAAEFYVGLTGSGLMLLEDEQSGESSVVALTPNAVVYVPGYTAHRTINVGDVPLTYLGIYPAMAGHDYGAIAERNFRSVVVASGGQPVQISRDAYLAELRSSSGNRS